jgi:hypothetical protein
MKRMPLSVKELVVELGIMRVDPVCGAYCKGKIKEPCSSASTTENSYGFWKMSWRTITEYPRIR